MALAPEEIEARLEAVVERVVPLLPEGWLDARLGYHALGSFEALTLNCEGPRDAWALPGTGVLEELRELRGDCHDPETGTWPGLTLLLDSADGWGVEPEELDDFRWREEITPEDVGLELARFPRPDWRLPPWMSALRDLDRDAAAFDPEEIIARPRPEDGLLGEKDAGYFAEARRRLDDLLPGGGDRIPVGRLEDGRWSVVPAGSAWLAVRYSGGRCDSTRAFAGARAALAHAAARDLAELGVPVDSELMRTAGVLTGQSRPREGLDAWVWGKAGTRAAQLTGGAPRPPGGAYIALDPLGNRPGGYFVCQTGPAPEAGPFIGVHRVFELALLEELPPLREAPPVPAEPVPAEPETAEAAASAEPAYAPPREPAARPDPVVVLPAGTEVDAYDHHDRQVVHTVGTPGHRRGRVDRDSEPVYRLYRVDKPLPAVPVGFAPLPILGGEDAAERARTARGQGYRLAAEIGELLRSGHLSEIGGPGGTAPPPPAPRITERRRTNPMAPESSGAQAVRQSPAPYDQERHDELLQRLGRVLVEVSPDGWARIDLRVRMTVPVSEVALTVVMEDGGTAEAEPPRDLWEIAAELRSMMYRRDEGTWFAMRFTVSPPAEYWASFNGEFDPEWSPPITAEDWRHDLSVFPRTAEHVPRWLRDRLDAGG